MSEDKPKSDGEPQGSFVRWQSIRIAQLTYAVDLFLALSIAVLWFQIALLLNEKFVPVWCLQKGAFSLSLLALAVSVFLGFWVTVNRLESFRETAQAARAREQERTDDHKAHKARYEELDGRTWCLFFWQIGMFGTGLVFVFLSVVVPAVAAKLLF